MKFRLVPSQALLIAAVDVACLLRERDTPGARFVGVGEVDDLRIGGAERRERMCDVRRRFIIRGLGMYSSSVSLSLSSSASSSERWTGAAGALRVLLRPKDSSGTGALEPEGAGIVILDTVAFDRRVFGRVVEEEGLGLGRWAACGSSKDLWKL